jgi:hypothetical protein
MNPGITHKQNPLLRAFTQFYVISAIHLGRHSNMQMHGQYEMQINTQLSSVSSGRMPSTMFVRIDVIHSADNNAGH